MIVARKLTKTSVSLTQRELEALKGYADLTERTQSEVIRDYIRSLPTYEPPIQTTDKADT
jgi:hypothetical protein